MKIDMLLTENQSVAFSIHETRPAASFVIFWQREPRKPASLHDIFWHGPAPESAFLSPASPSPSTCWRSMALPGETRFWPS